MSSAKSRTSMERTSKAETAIGDLNAEVEQLMITMSQVVHGTAPAATGGERVRGRGIYLPLGDAPISNSAAQFRHFTCLDLRPSCTCTPDLSGDLRTLSTCTPDLPVDLRTLSTCTPDLPVDLRALSTCAPGLPVDLRTLSTCAP